ncbi:unnamed protein product [Penicillium camemberti]|uniref:Str. FM013 n=1 Tax=Penicillium camemberti (strain FM 013) TaxID=1429867 RepID=A0A0G4PWD6_PENC3|nr:unnamed protein product [Penicillium camemberti]
MFSKFFHNGVRERLPSLQLGLEALGIAFRHQVEDYKFVSFYSDTDQIVPIDSAVLNLAGHREAQGCLGADRSDLCCFLIGSDSYKRVKRHLWMLCEEVIQEQSMST